MREACEGEDVSDTGKWVMGRNKVMIKRSGKEEKVCV